MEEKHPAHAASEPDANPDVFEVRKADQFDADAESDQVDAHPVQVDPDAVPDASGNV